MNRQASVLRVYFHQVFWQKCFSVCGMSVSLGRLWTKAKDQPQEHVKSFAKNCCVRDQRKHFVIERYSLSRPPIAHPSIYSFRLWHMYDDPTALNINKSPTICTQKSKDTQRIGRQANIKCQFLVAKWLLPCRQQQQQQQLQQLQQICHIRPHTHTNTWLSTYTESKRDSEREGEVWEGERIRKNRRG